MNLRILSAVVIAMTMDCLPVAAGELTAPTPHRGHAPGPGDADYPAPSPSGRHNEKVKAIEGGQYDLVMIGDSITQNLGDSGGEWEPLKAVWNKHFAPRKAINLGYSGYRTENIIWNLQNGELNFKQSPKVFTLLIGTNNTDDQHYGRIDNAKQLFAGTKAIVDLIRTRHPTSKIILLRPFPCGGPGAVTDSQRKYNRSAKAMEALLGGGDLTRQLADDKQVFWRELGYVFLRPDGTINTDLMPDLIHPNAAGSEAWAQALETTLAPLMGDKPITDPQPRSIVPVIPGCGYYDWPARHRDVLESKKTNPEIVFIGDSITHHMNGIPKPPNGFDLGVSFWKDVCDDHRRGLNLGFGADWTQHALWRLDNGEIDGISPKHIVLMIGTNNVLGGEGAGDILPGIRACVSRIRYKVPQAKLILMGVLPCRNPVTNPNRAVVLKLNESLKSLAVEAKCEFLDIGGQFLDDEGKIPGELMHDAIHPSAKGYKIWSEALIPMLR